MEDEIIDLTEDDLQIDPPAMPISSSWEREWVGKICEIYWSPSSTTPTSSTQQGCVRKRTNKRKRSKYEDDADDFEADWYDGTIVSFSDGLFHVQFLGEEKLYTMKLQRTSIRPSARAWIQDTVPLLLTPSSFDRPKYPNTPFKIWRDQLEKQITIFKSIIFDQSSLNPDTVDEDSIDPAEERNSKRKYSKDRGSHSKVGAETGGNQTLQIFTDQQLEDEVDLLEDGFPLDKVPQQEYLGKLGQNLEFCSRLCVWGTMVDMEYKTVEWKYFSSLSNFLGRGIQYILDSVRMQISYKGGGQTSKMSGNPYNSFLQSWFQLFDDINGDKVNFIPILNRRQDIRHLLNMCNFRKQTYPYRLWIPHMADILQRHYDDYWWPAYCWIEESNRILGYVVILEHQAKKDNRLEFEGVEQDRMPEKTSFTVGDIDSHMCLYQNLPQGDLHSYQDALIDKITYIRNVATQLWQLMGKCTDEPIEILTTEFLRYAAFSPDMGDEDDRPWQFVNNVDPILRDLCHIQAQWKSDPRLSNVSSIGTSSSSKSSETLSLETLEQVVFVRRWIVDMKIVDSRRERHSLVTSVISRGSSVPHLPTLPVSLLPLDSSASKRPSTAEYISQILGRLASLSSHVYSSGIIATNYDRWFQESRSDSFPIDCSQESIALRSLPGVRQALDILEKLPIVYPVEEYLYVRWKVLVFHKYAEPKLSISGKRISFQDLSHMHQCAQALRLHRHVDFPIEELPKKSQPRLLYDDASEGKLMLISDSEMNLFCAGISQSLNELFQKASSWKSETDLLISYLKQSRMSSPTITISQSADPNQMVHFSRIDELLRLYEQSPVLFDEEYAFLNQVRNDVCMWIYEINDLMRKYNGNPIHLSVLRTKNEQRPKGIITEPSTETVETWMKCMDWYQQVMALDLSKSSQVSDAAYYTSFIRDQVEPLLWEGYEILIDDAVVENMPLFYREVPKHLSTTVNLKLSIRNRRSLSAKSLKSTESGLHFLKSLSTMDVSGKSKIFVFQLLLWDRAAVVCQHSRGIQRLSLSAVRALIESVSSPSNAWNIHILASTFQIASYVLETDYKPLSTSVESSTHLEEAIVKALADCNLFEGDFCTKSSLLNDLYTRVSNLTLQVSSPSVLQICPVIEQQLAKLHRKFRWLDHCRQYPILFVNSADPQIAEVDKMDEKDEDDRIPILNLLALCSSIVNDNRENDQQKIITSRIDKNITRIEGHVRELVDAVTTWQNDVRKQCITGVVVNLCYLEKLYNNAILSKVFVLPEEDMLYSIIDQGLQIKMALNLFLTLPNLNDDTALVMQLPPRSHSLVGRSGEFILFQFYNSSLYSQMKKYFGKCIPLCQKINIITGEKRALQWISDCLLWLDTLGGKFNNSTGHKLTIGSDDCKESIASAAHLLTISNDVTATLASYSVGIAVKQPSGKVSLNVSNLAVSCSVGCYALRWFLFFSNALLADLIATEAWNASVEKFSTLFHSISSPQKKKEYLKKINDLLDDMSEKLVVLPSAATLNCAIAIRSSEDRTAIESYIHRDTGITSDRFENDEKIVADRFGILDNLLNRKANARGGMIIETCWDHIYESGSAHESSEILPNELVRLKSRSLFESSFIKAIENIGIEKSSEMWRDTISLCSILAWELETIVYDKLVGEGNEDCERLVNEEYKAKVRSLRFNLEDKKNPLLCARVLLGILSMSSLVDMTPEQLASKDLQETRAKVEEESKRSYTINPVVNTKEPVPQSKDAKQSNLIVGNITEAESKQNSSIYNTTVLHTESILKMEETTMMNTPYTTLKETENGIRFESKTASSFSGSGSTTEPTVTQAIEYPLSNEHNSDKNIFIIDSSSDDMGKSLLNDDDEDETDTTKLPSLGRSGNLVMSLSGTRDYLFTIKAMKISFSAGLFWDKNLHVPFQAVSNLIPHDLADRGRVPIDEFNNFISAKTKSNKWDMVPLKLVNIHDEDEANFKAFYKEYESIRRIAMFRVDDIHIYLVTPKFIDAAYCLREIIANKKPSTYAVLLVKRSV